MLPLWGHGTLQEGVPKVGVSVRRETSVISGEKGGFKLQRGNSRGLSQPLIANIHGLKEVKEGGEVEMEEIWNMEGGNQQDSPPLPYLPVGDYPADSIFPPSILLPLFYFFETMYIGNKGLTQASRVAPLEFKASLFS